MIKSTYNGVTYKLLWLYVSNFPQIMDGVYIIGYLTQTPLDKNRKDLNLFSSKGIQLFKKDNYTESLSYRLKGSVRIENADWIETNFNSKITLWDNSMNEAIVINISSENRELLKSRYSQLTNIKPTIINSDLTQKDFLNLTYRVEVPIPNKDNPKIVTSDKFTINKTIPNFPPSKHSIYFILEDKEYIISFSGGNWNNNTMESGGVSLYMFINRNTTTGGYFNTLVGSTGVELVGVNVPDDRINGNAEVYSFLNLDDFKLHFGNKITIWSYGMHEPIEVIFTDDDRKLLYDTYNEILNEKSSASANLQ